MARTITKFAIAALCLLALAVFTPQAKAGSADFSCSGTGTTMGQCNGTIVQNGSNFSTSGVTLVAGSPFTIPLGDGDEAGENYSIAFSTATGNITITDTDDADSNLTGTITGHSMVGAAVLLDVMWTIPGGYQTSPGFVSLALTGTPCAAGTAAGLSCFDSNSVDIPVVTPEPASLLLMGTGLLGLGGVVRRRWLS